MTMPGTSCAVQASGSIELYFYDELDPQERAAFDRHRAACPHCRQALEDLLVIRRALASRPAVAAPPADDWAGFMSRLDAAIDRETRPSVTSAVVPFVGADGRRSSVRSSLMPLLAMAALLALVTMSVLFVARSRDAALPAGVQNTNPTGTQATGDTPAGDTGTLSSVSQQHLERSKLVLLGLATKDAAGATGSDWTYERELASTLLTDTRLYRMAAEERGLDTLAGVMRDLELVLLQTSMTEGEDPAALSQIQRAIRKRDLLQKMDVVRTSIGT
jgi:hypothetical protein